MAKKFVRILEDIEEALAREVRKITFFSQRTREPEAGHILKEVFDVFTGEYVQKPVEPSFYSDLAHSNQQTSPYFFIKLLSLSEDLDSGRVLPTVGNQITIPLTSAPVYAARFGGEDLLTTNATPDSTVTLSHRHIRSVEAGDLLKILTGENIGVYTIGSVTLTGNGPHTITLSNDIVQGLPAFEYAKQNGIIIFNSTVDLTAVKIGDLFIDSAANAATITAVNSPTGIAVAPNSNLVATAGAKINRSGAVLQGLDDNDPQCYTILDPSTVISGVSQAYRKTNPLIPYTFLYYIKITSRERDDHIAVANKMMQSFNPPRGALSIITRYNTSYQDSLLQTANIGDKVVYLKDASKLSVGEKVRLFSNLSRGEETVIESINYSSNTVTLKNTLTQQYKIEDCAALVSNTDICVLQRDFLNHSTEDRESEQLWIHRFSFRVQGWIEAKIDPLSEDPDGATYEDVGDVNFIKVCLEDIEGTLKDVNLIT